MVFHARKWGWKRIAAHLLLVPMLAGGSAAFGQTQSTTGGSTPATPGRMTGPPAGRMSDPKQLLKDGRKALAEGRFNDAKDLAQRAEANNPSGKWGLFDDTPASLRKDIEVALAKAHKVEAVHLITQAKTFMTKPAANDGERAYNLDAALQCARKANDLHGPYSVWDLSERPDKLVKDIEAARAKLRTSPVPPNGAMTAGPAPPANGQPATTNRPTGNGMSPTAPPSGVVNAAGQPTAASPKFPATAPALASQPAPAAAMDPKKVAAIKLMAEARQLADKGDFGPARAKLLEADRAGAVFTVNEPNPGFALQELNTRGAAAIDRLIREAQDGMAKKDFPKADAALNGASQIVTALSLFAKPVDDARAALRQASSGKYGGPAPTAPTEVVASTDRTPAAPTAPVSPTALPAAPMSPVAGRPVAPPMNPTAPMVPGTPGVAAVSAKPAPAGSVNGRQLLDQAAFEFQKGNLDMAVTLARQAHNLGLRDEATGLLNQIDAERLAQRQRTAAKSLDAAIAATQSRDFSHALSVLVLIDPKLLPEDKRARRDELLATCRAETEKSGGPSAGVVPTTGQQPPMTAPPSALDPMGAASQPGARPGPPTDPKAADPNSLTNQVDSMRKLAFQKLRSDGLKIQADAQAAFGRGDTDVAIQMLVDYENRVRSSDLEAASVAMLLRPVDSRLEMFRVMKGQADALSREKKDKREAKDLIVGRGAAEDQRKAEVQKLVREYHRLVKVSDYTGAEKVALQAKQLEPDNEAISALALMAKMNRRSKEQQDLRDAKEKMVYEGLTSAEQPGHIVSTEEPVYVDIERMRRSSRRGSLDDVYQRNRSPREYEIELQLDKPIKVEFNLTPLELAVENVRSLTGLPMVFDYPALEAEGLSTAKPVTMPAGQPIATRHLLAVVLEQAGMSFVIEHDMVKLTSLKKSKGRLFTKVFSVADLVTPIPNFALPDYSNFDKMMNKNALNSGQIQLQGQGGPTPLMPSNGLGNGAPAGTMSGLAPGVAGSTFGQGGTLQSNPVSPGNGPNPLGSSANLAGDRNTKHEQLIKLITGMVRPYSWDGMGGPGRIEYFDVGSALVVNQTADVIREVADLLEALRRLQDLAVAVEIRIISLAETFFERMGVDFSMNIQTHNTAFEPALTSGVFRPDPYLNDLNGYKGITVGLTQAGAGQPGGVGFTPDLNVPIRSTSFNYAIPPFGNYPNSPGADGGVSLGLAFLNDIQVYLFMELAQGDRRTNVMQAPKITLFNGQTATLAVNALQFFVTSVQVVSVNGQLVFIPTNTPLPGPGSPFVGGGTINIGIQAVVSADRRFVRMNLPITLAAQSGATVPLFPVTTFITPVFEGGSQGVPIPFTQFLQQPAFTTLTVQTTVVCPDGGTVLLGGFKSLQEGRNEFGPPFLSKIPYLNRLFKNVGIGRTTSHVMIMVTPRIIINAEEEIIQTEGRQYGVAPGQ